MSTEATLDPPSRGISPFLTGGGDVGALMRAHDWSRSPLGPPEQWPQSLKLVVGLLLNSKFPMFVAWGPELGFLYNDAYAEILGAKHPAALGARFQDIWSEIWPDISPLIDSAMAGEATYREDLPLLLNRRGYDEQTWFTFSYSPVRDESGAVAGMFCAVAETTGRVLADRRLAEEKQRQQRLFEQAPGFICTLTGPDHVYEFVNESYRRLFGSRAFLGKTVREAFPELEGQGFYELLDRVYATGERVVAHHMPARLEDPRTGAITEQVLDFIYAPVLDEAGQVSGIFCEGFEVTETVRAGQALAQSEEQLRLATEASDVGLWDLDVIDDRLFWPPRVKAMFGISPEAPVSMADFEAQLHPDDRPRVTAAFAAAKDPDQRALYDVEYRTIGKEDGVMRWVAARGRAIFDETGRCVRVIGTALDITVRKRAEEYLRLMVNELNHRVKNTLATVQGIATQTLSRDEIPVEVRETLTSRLMALARAHDVLTNEKWAGADVHEMAEAAAAPYRGAHSSPFRLSGPKMSVPPNTAIALALVFHELATNAAKYGALSVRGGGVQLTWSAEPAPGGRLLRITWREVGGPPVAPPQKTGFGTRLIRRGLAAELNAAIELDYQPSGLVCSIQAVVGPAVEPGLGSPSEPMASGAPTPSQ